MKFLTAKKFQFTLTSLMMRVSIAVIAFLAAFAITKIVDSFSDNFSNCPTHERHIFFEYIANALAAGLIMFAGVFVCIKAKPTLLLALSAFWAVVAFIGRGGFFATEGFIDLSVFSTIIMLMVAILSRFGRTGSIILYCIFMLELALPLSMAIAFQIVDRKSVWDLIVTLSWTAGIGCAAYILSTPEQRFGKFNLRFAAITLLIFGLGFMVVPPIENWMNRLGSTWPGTTYATFSIFEVVKNNPLLVFLSCLFYYVASLKVLSAETIKTVNTVLLIYLALLLIGIFVTNLFGVRMV